MIKDDSKEYREVMQEIMFEIMLKADKLSQKLKEGNKTTGAGSELIR